MTGAPAYPYRYAPNGDGASIGGGGGAKGSGASGGAVGGPCGACKFLRRKCVEECIFAPYFNCEKGQSNFAIVHRIFGSSNVAKLLARLPENHRMDACVSICYEAQARVRDPVYGCVAHILTLQQQVTNLQAEIAYLRAHLAPVQVPTPPPPPPPQPITGLPPPMVDLHSAPPSTFDLSSLFDPTVPTGLHPPFQGQGQVHSPMGPLRISCDDGASTSAVGSGSGSGSDAELQALARELLMQEPFDHVPHNGQSSSVPKSD